MIVAKNCGSARVYPPLGAAETQRFIDEGVDIVAVDVNADALKELTSSLGADESRLLAVAVDITDYERVREAVERGVAQIRQDRHPGQQRWMGYRQAVPADGAGPVGQRQLMNVRLEQPRRERKKARRRP